MYSVDLKGVAAHPALYERLTTRLADYTTPVPVALFWHDERLHAKQLEENTVCCLDFVSGTVAFRSAQISVKKEAVARAVGMKNRSALSVIDATAGLCRDSFILASLGCHVVALERDPLVYSLVEDSLRRAYTTPELVGLSGQLEYKLCSSIDYLQQGGAPVDAIYLDPMFPEKQKSAKVKKDMRFLQAVVGPDQDSTLLLQAALAYPCKRVAVKRPAHATSIAHLTPQFTLGSKKFRFDIYTPQVVSSSSDSV